MQQDNNHIENKLRQLENQQLPDLSAMEQHWKKVETTLMLPLAAGKKTVPGAKWFVIIAATAVIAFVLFIVTGKQQMKTADTAGPVAVPATMQQTQDAIVTDPVREQAPGKPVVQTGKKNISMPRNTHIPPAVKKDEDTLAAAMTNPLLNTDTQPVKPSMSFEEKQGMLQQFVTSLKKKASFFTFRNDRDTVLLAAEGTSVYVPANSFSAKDSVQFEIMEFYKYSDMLLNGLTTMADNNQLVTGGMFRLSAKVNGHIANINPGSEIRVFVPGICKSDSMLVFEGVQNNRLLKKATASMTADTLASENIAGDNRVNWVLNSTRIDSPVIKMFIRAIDLKDDQIEYRTSYNKTKAVFHRAVTSVYSRDELKTILQKKYGDYYDIIKVRKQWERNIFFQKQDRLEEEYGEMVYNSWGVGDTAELLPSTVRIYKLTPIDTVYNVVNWIYKGYQTVRRPSITGAMAATIGDKFSIGLTRLGWINCDRFYNYPGKTLNFTVDIEDSAVHYMTYLVFNKFRSIMGGTAYGNHVYFSNVPEGEDVKVFAVGIREGKVVASVAGTTTSSNILKGMRFEEMSMGDFKTTVKAQLDK